LRRIGTIDAPFLTWVFVAQGRTSLQVKQVNVRSRYSTNKPGVPMSIVKRHLAEHEERLVLIEELCIDKGALVYDIDSDEVFFSADEDAYKNAYVAVFQAWANGTIKGTAEQVFDATKSILED
jgi:hypothetical protein